MSTYFCTDLHKAAPRQASKKLLYHRQHFMWTFDCRIETYARLFADIFIEIISRKCLGADVRMFVHKIFTKLFFVYFRVNEVIERFGNKVLDSLRKHGLMLIFKILTIPHIARR